jgi:hypothetical protein
MVALNDQLISFFCPDQHYLIYYKTSEFLSNNLSSPEISLLSFKNLEYTKFHRNSGEYLVTGPMDSSANFYIGYLNSEGKAAYTSMFKENYNPKIMAFDSSIFIMVGNYLENENYISVIGVVSLTGLINVKERSDTLLNSIDIKEIEVNKTVRLFYTKPASDGSFNLYREITDLDQDFDGSNLASVSIGTN